MRAPTAASTADALTTGFPLGQKLLKSEEIEAERAVVLVQKDQSHYYFKGKAFQQ